MLTTDEFASFSKSHLARVRGLKRQYRRQHYRYHLVAPCTGAWIETALVAELEKKKESHLARVRGLKLIHACSLVTPQSHLARVRGLKQIAINNNYRIRTSHLARVRGLKHHLIEGLFSELSRTLHGCVD